MTTLNRTSWQGLFVLVILVFSHHTTNAFVERLPFGLVVGHSSTLVMRAADTRRLSSSSSSVPTTRTKSRMPKSRAAIIEKKRRKQESDKKKKLLRETPPPPQTVFDQRPCLVLNADYQPLSYIPLSLWNWQDAIKSVFLGKVTVVDVYPDLFVRAANCEFPLPSVIALHEYVPQQRFPDTPAFTRRNVLIRDGFRCQYCLLRFHARDLSLDHVHPRSMGGRLTWDNAVTSCLSCNTKKGCTPVSDLRKIGMRLYKAPVVPSKYDLLKSASRMMLPKDLHSTWKPYLHALRETKGGEQFDNDEIHTL